MTYDPERHHRRSIKWRGYDYGQPGAYFVTICVQNRRCHFGKIDDHAMSLSPAGLVIESWWGTIPCRFPDVALDKYVVMPNHLHGLIMLRPDSDTTLPNVVQWFKSATTTDYRRGVEIDGWESFDGKLWQRNYYEHVVRDETDLERVRGYITENPLRWHEDDENPTVTRIVAHGRLPQTSTI